jgi:hypothetical protein
MVLAWDVSGGSVGRRSRRLIEAWPAWRVVSSEVCLDQVMVWFEDVGDGGGRSESTKKVVHSPLNIRLLRVSYFCIQRLHLDGILLWQLARSLA